MPRWANQLTGWAAASVFCFAALPAGSQPLGPVGAEFQVNAYTSNDQRAASIAASSAGDFVLIWESDGSAATDASARSIQGQRYASDGSGLGAEFQVNTYTTSDQKLASVAVDADGDFIAVWSSNGSAGTDASTWSIQGQRYASDGSALGVEFQVNAFTTDSQYAPSVAAAANGDFVVVWESYGSAGTDASGFSIQGQRYASDGSAQAAEFQVNTYTSVDQLHPSAAAAPDGDFVVVWQSYGSYGTDASSWSIQGQRYASDGSALGGEFQVNTYTSLDQLDPSAAAAASGDFVVVWQSYGSYGTDTSSWSIQGQRYASDGSTLGAEFQVNTWTTSYQDQPSVAAVADGSFVVAWGSYGSYGTDTWHISLQAQRYASDGSAQGTQLQVNTYTTGSQYQPAVAVADPGFVVVWNGEGSSGTDASYLSVHGQRFGVAAPVKVPSLSPGAAATAAVLLLLAAGLALRRRG